MSKNIPNIKDRVLYFADLEEGNKQNFFKNVELKYSNFTGKSKESDLNSKSVAEILLKYPKLNPIWLLTGQGEIHINSHPINDHVNPIVNDVNLSYETIPKGAIPYYNLPVSAGKSILAIDGSINPDGYIKDIPGIGNAEAFLPVHGYSMHPEIKEGAIIGVKKANNYDHLNTQNKYLIITHEDRMVKYIRHDTSNINILWCISPNYGDFSILKDDIVEIYRVTVVMNPE